MTSVFVVQSAASPDGRYFLYWFGIVVLWFPIGCWILGQVHGWKRLYRKFPAPAEVLTGPKFSFLGGKIGLLVWRNALFAQVTPQGLRLSVLFLFRSGHPPLLIPWTEIKNVSPRKDFIWRGFTDFEIGAPPIAKVRLPTRVLAASPLVVPE
jgi:hypothetical protein